MQKHIKHITERHRYNMVHPNDGLCPHKNCQSFYYCPERWRDTTYNNTIALPLHALTASLTQSHRLFTIQYPTHPYYNSFLLYGKYHGKILWLTQYHGSAKLLANKHPKHKVVECVYSTPRVQTWLNDIYEYGRLGSTTNNIPLGD